MKIRDVMTTDVVTVRPDSSLREVARLLTERGISGLPVVDSDGHCVGVVSEADVVVKELGHPEPRSALEWILGWRPDVEQQRRRRATTALEAMTAPPITIAPDRPLRIAADLMVGNRVNRLPVVDGDRLVGIVTRADLVRAYLRLDEEIATTIRNDILERTMWLDASTIRVDVQEGAVRLTGSVDRRSTAHIIEKLVGLVDGVTGVDRRLMWRFDDLEVDPAPLRPREPGAASLTARDSVHR